MSGRSIKRAIASPIFSLPLQSGQMGEVRVHYATLATSRFRSG